MQLVQHELIPSDALLLMSQTGNVTATRFSVLISRMLLQQFSFAAGGV